MAKIDTVREIEKTNGRKVSVELTQRQLDDLLKLAELGDDGLKEFDEKHIEYNAGLPEDVRLNLTNEPEKEESETPDVPENESSRTVQERAQVEKELKDRQEQREATNEAIESTIRRGRKNLDQVREESKRNAAGKIRMQQSRIPDPDVTEGPKVTVTLNQKIQDYGGIIFDPSTRAKVMGSNPVEVIRTPFISQKISSGELKVVEQ